ncbi:hypothetical protein SAV31267_096250 [Streptomyces avermitilis]|uniref:Uncharacterized protein n=2 Tax=Streptomyces avermitilis TaxID=33903 RepID=A0A4D4N6V1_STRAX|nr:hypothetical protein SAVMC3_03810 [Streptomyces avermitilis]GDY80140.1 hypothetical protein SAV31267_096250 [Streptomyces avermitilis]
MLAHAFLVTVRVEEHARRPAPDGLLPLSCNEIQRLFIALIVRPVHDAAHPLVRLAAAPSSPSPRRPLPSAGDRWPSTAGAVVGHCVIAVPDGCYLGDMTS